MEENNNISGPVEPSTATPSSTEGAIGNSVASNVVSLASFRDNKTNQKIEKNWPATAPGENVEVTASPRDPSDRRILLSLLHGDVVMDGHLGLTQTFLAIGDSNGRIKFAAAPGQWMYATDVTDDPTYQDEDNTPSAA